MVGHLVNQCKSQNKCYHFLVEIVEKCSGFIPITEMRTPPPSKWPVLIIISERKFQTMDFSQIRICRPDPPSVLIRFLWMVRCVLNKFFFFDFYFSSYEKFIENWVDEVTKNDQKRTITRKIEIGKIWNFIFPLIQPIPDVSCKFEHFTFHLNLKKKM